MREEFLTQSEDRSRPDKRFGVLLALASLPPGQRTLFVVALVVLAVTSFVFLTRFTDRLLVEIPKHGGELSEGVIGRPRFINPIIGKSDVDRDMMALIYSGLMKAGPNGTFLPDLAKEFTISPDGLSYRFVLRDELYWHDGVPITSEDILFTIEKVRDPKLAIKSPRRASWEGVGVEASDQKTVIFSLKQPYAPFLENTTMGILPKHIWQNVPDEEFDITYYNIEPIGSGPYRVVNIAKDNDKGLPSSYHLVAFQKYALGEPYITDLNIYFFGNNNELVQAFDEGRIAQMHTVDPAEVERLTKTGVTFIRDPLPRSYALYFNQNKQPIFLDGSVRLALALAINKNAIIKEVLRGYGDTIAGPLAERTQGNTASEHDGMDAGDARGVLEKAGWVVNAAGIYEKVDKKKKTITPLQFSIAVPDVDELKRAGEMIRASWASIGADVTLKVYDTSTFTGEVLSPRSYDVLLYGQIMGHTPDPYAYWHSSQRNPPGLNIALYANKTVDKLLEDIRKEHDTEKRAGLLSEFSQEIARDIPAVFLYSPDFLYAVAPNVRGIETGLITREEERWSGIQNWYVDSEKVLPWFAKKAMVNQ